MLDAGGSPQGQVQRGCYLGSKEGGGLRHIHHTCFQVGRLLMLMQKVASWLTKLKELAELFTSNLTPNQTAALEQC